MSKNFIYKGKDYKGNDYKVFDLSYLSKKELSEDDLYWLFDTESSLIYSLVIGMFTYLHIDKKYEDIINDARNDESWFNKYKWTSKQKYDFRNTIVKVFKNIYQLSDIECEDKADWFLFMYGLSMTNKECDKYLKMLW